MRHYSWVLFDADDTLFHFDAFMGLKRLFARFDIEFTEQDFEAYQLINKPLWVDYQNGVINAQQLQSLRFADWGTRLNCSPHDLNYFFIEEMTEICTPIDGAVSLLNALKGRVNLGIITNGFTQLQEARLERTGFKEYFDVLVISEEVGIAKPDKAIFDYTLSLIGEPPRERILMVGDNPDSDILGGINAGIDTCWFNADNKTLPEGITPDYQVRCLSELERLFL